MGRKSKRKRMNSSQSRSLINMSNTPQAQMSNLTFAIQNANDTLYGPSPYLHSASPIDPNLQGMQLNQLGPHCQSSTPIHNNNFQSNPPPLHPNSGQGQGQYTQMSTMGQIPINNDIGVVLNDIQNKLTKLNLLDSIVDRLRNIEQRFDAVESDIVQLKRSVTDHQNCFETNNQDMNNFHTRLRDMETARGELEDMTNKMHESFLDQQSRAMKYNLIFENIPEFKPDPTSSENTEKVLVDFLKSEMKIENGIHFHNVHRLKPRRDRKPPSIVAKFLYNNDKEKVLRASRTELVGKPFKVYQQYPQEISERRRQLVPIMKELREQNQRAYIVRDKLYVNGRPYIPNERGPPRQFNNMHRMQQEEMKAKDGRGNNLDPRQVQFS